MTHFDEASDSFGKNRETTESTGQGDSGNSDKHCQSEDAAPSPTGPANATDLQDILRYIDDGNPNCQEPYVLE